MKKDDLNFEFSFFEDDNSYYGGKRKKKKVKPEKIIAVILFLSIIIVLEYFFGNKTKYISLIFFGNNDYKRCVLLNKLDLYKYDIRYVFIFIMFTYINLYAVFCYMAADVVLMIINDIIRLSIFETRPFWDDNKKVFPCVCEFTPSSPSPISTKSFLFFSLFIFVQYEEKLKNKEINRMIPVETKKLSDLNESNISEIQIKNERSSNFKLILLAIFLISLIVFIDTIPLLQNIEYIHQTFYGISLGFCFYYLVFYIFNVKHFSTKQFFKIIKQPWIILTFAVILIFLIFFIINHIAYAITTSQIEQIERFCEIPDDFTISTEILKNCSLLFETLGAYFGILLEYRITFKSKESKFLPYNVRSRKNEGYNENISQWKKIILFLLLFFTEYIIFKSIIEFWIKNHSEGIYLFVALSLELFFKGIFFFYIMKRFLSKIGFLNNDIFLKKK